MTVTTAVDVALDEAAMQTVTTPPVVDPDVHTETWPPDRAFAFWVRVGREQMTFRLAADGRWPGAFDRHVAALEESLLAASSGGYLAVAFHGIREGFVQAAEAYWTDLATEAGRSTDLADDAGAYVRFDLEREASRWTAVPTLTATLTDIVTEAFVLGYRTSHPYEPKHARDQQRKTA